MIVKCAWCGSLIGEKEPLEDLRNTHGICRVCASGLDIDLSLYRFRLMVKINKALNSFSRKEEHIMPYWKSKKKDMDEALAELANDVMRIKRYYTGPESLITRIYEGIGKARAIVGHLPIKEDGDGNRTGKTET